MISVFEYLDYRAFLKDYYEERKKDEPFFSYRFMANRINMDHSLLVKILTGKRHVSDKAIEEFASLCKLSKKESLYFSTLIHFEKARTQKESKRYFEELLEMRSFSSTSISKDQYEYFNKWYYAAIRSLLDYYPFKGDYKELADQLSPRVTVIQAKQAIELLIRLSLIKEDENGIFRVTEAHVTTGEKWHDLAISAFQKETISLSTRAIENHRKEKRDISSVTMSINEECFRDVKEILRECREAIIKRVDVIPDNCTDRVYQVNMQLIPLSVNKVEN